MIKNHSNKPLSRLSLRETANHFLATIPIPGLTERDIEVCISRDLLSVWSRNPFVGFLRSVPFPKNTLPSFAEAFVSQNRLIVRVPKALRMAS